MGGGSSESALRWGRWPGLIAPACLVLAQPPGNAAARAQQPVRALIGIEDVEPTTTIRSSNRKLGYARQSHHPHPVHITHSGDTRSVDVGSCQPVN